MGVTTVFRFFTGPSPHWNHGHGAEKPGKMWAKSLENGGNDGKMGIQQGTLAWNNLKIIIFEKIWMCLLLFAGGLMISPVKIALFQTDSNEWFEVNLQQPLKQFYITEKLHGTKCKTVRDVHCFVAFLVGWYAWPMNLLENPFKKSHQLKNCPGHWLRHPRPKPTLGSDPLPAAPRCAKRGAAPPKCRWNRRSTRASQQSWDGNRIDHHRGPSEVNRVQLVNITIS